MRQNVPGIRKHVKNIEFRLGSINFIRGPKSLGLLPITLPLGLYFMKRIRSPHSTFSTQFSILCTRSRILLIGGNFDATEYSKAAKRGKRTAALEKGWTAA